MVEITDYDHIDPLDALQLNLLVKGAPLTPVYAAQLRSSDSCACPDVAYYAVEDGKAIGGVGFFLRTMETEDGPVGVGVLWLVTVHPQHAGRGVGSQLLAAAHDKMRASGLRFSVLNVNRNHTAFQLFKRHGYFGHPVWHLALSSWEQAHQPTRFTAAPAGPEGYSHFEGFFDTVSGNYLGFTHRTKPFAPLRRVDQSTLWIIRDNSTVIGSALVEREESILTISDLLIQTGIDAAEAAASIAARNRTDYIQVRGSRPAAARSLVQAGYRLASPDWETFMIKPLNPEDGKGVFKRFAIGTDMFLISPLDFS